MPSLSRYRIHKNLVPFRRNTTPSFSIGLATLHLLFERSAERCEIRFEKPDVATHYAEMGNLLSLDPKIHSLGTDAKKLGSLPNCEWIFLRDCRGSPVEFNEKVAIHMRFLWLSSGWSIAVLFRPLFVTSPESPSNTVLSSVWCTNTLFYKRGCQEKTLLHP